MKSLISNNVMDATKFNLPALGIIPQIAVLRDVKLSYATDSDGKRTENVASVRYDCVDTENFSTFTVKVETSKPVITSGELENTDELVVLELPIDEMTIKPYEISYGKVKVSIIAPYVKVQKG